MSSILIHDPDTKLDYGITWALADGDTIAESQWLPVAGLTLSDEGHDAASTVVWVEGGTVGVQYALVNRVTTAQGRTADKTLYLRCAQT